MTARRFVVKGRVQGVGFRFFTVRAARRHDVSGWVRNLPDGSVEVQAQGTASSLESFREDLNRGPAGAAVHCLEEIEVAASGDAGGFDVRF